MPSSERTPADLVHRAQEILSISWKQVGKQGAAGALGDVLEGDLLADVRAAVNSQTKSYRYVLPTQLIAKLAAPTLDCRCLQAARGGRGAFDARTIAHEVVVPFDQTNNNVLGGSPEPYVNNPLRVPEVSVRFAKQQKNKKDWDALCRVLAVVQEGEDADLAGRVLRQTLTEVYRRLAETHVVYPAPKRVSLDAALRILRRFLEPGSGGDRLLAVTAALFAVLGRRFGLYDEVRRSNITAADASTGLPADLECVANSGETILAVEAKDRELTITQVRSKMASIRERQISEVFFIAQQGVAAQDRDAVAEQVEREFVGGHNVYITDVIALSETALSLLGESGRREFLGDVGLQLDQYRSDIVHRRSWAELLGSL
jgi:hypothetical protein